MIFTLRKVVMLLCTSLFRWLPTYAQNAGQMSQQGKTAGRTTSINGFVRDKESGEPLPYANVYLEDTKLGAATDAHGYYVMTGIPAGKHTIVVAMIGYEKIEKIIDIQLKAKTRFDFEVAPQAIEAGEVVVTAEKMRFEKEVEISRINIDLKEIESIPAFVEADVFRAVQQLPSVTSQNDFSSALICEFGRHAYNCY